jgi:hypothetical protein
LCSYHSGEPDPLRAEAWAGLPAEAAGAAGRGRSEGRSACLGLPSG